MQLYKQIYVFFKIKRVIFNTQKHSVLKIWKGKTEKDLDFQKKQK